MSKRKRRRRSKEEVHRDAAGKKLVTMFFEDVPEDLKCRFKGACYKKNRTMRQEVIRFMANYCVENS